MIKIEVTGKNRDIKFDGGSMVAQEAYAHLPGHKYPDLIEIVPPKGQQAYAPGFYTLDPDSFYVGQYKKLSLNPKLVPAKA